MRYIAKAAALLLPIVILLAAGVLAVRRMGGVAPVSKSAIQDALSRALSRKVSIGSARARLNGRLALRDVRVEDKSGEPLASASRIIVRYTYRPGRNLSENVHSIRIEDPVLNLRRDKQGRWNIQDLLERPRAARPAAFSAALTISGGTVNLTDEAADKPRRTAFRNLSARVHFLNTSEGQFAVSARGSYGVVQAVSASGGFYRGGFQATITARGLALEPVLPQFISTKTATVTSGLADVRAQVAAAAERGGWKNPDYVVAAGVRGCDLRIPRLKERIRNLSGQFSIAGRNVRVEAATATLGTDRLRFSGAVLDWNKPLLNLKVAGAVNASSALSAFGHRGLPKDVSIHSPVQFSVFVTGNPSNPSISGTASVRSASLGPFEIGQAEAGVSYASRRLSVRGLRARVASGLVQADGWVAFDNPPKAVFSGEVRGVQTEPLLAKAQEKASVSGAVTGPVWVSWQPGRLRVVARASLTGGRAYNVPVESAYFDITREKQYLVIRRAAASSRDGTVEASGRVSRDGSLNVDFAAADVALAEVGKSFDRQGLSGQANAWGHVTGTLKDPRVEGYAQCAGLKYKDVDADLLSGRFLASRQAIRIPEATAYAKGSEIAVSGAVTGTGWREGKGQAEFLVESDRISLEDLLDAAGLKMEAVGSAAAAVAVSGPLDSLSLRGELNAADAFVAGQHIQSARASFDWQDGNLRVQQFKAALPSSEITASGGIARDGSLDFHFEAPAFDLADLDMKSLAGADLDMSGKVSLTGEVGGTSKEPVIRASVQSPGFSINGSRFGQAGVKANLKGNVVSIEEASLSHSGGSYSLSGTADTKQRTGELQLGVKDGDISAIRTAFESISPAFGQKGGRLSARLAALPRPLRGNLNGTATLAGPFKEPRGTLNLAAANMAIAELELPDLEATVPFEWPRFEIAAARATKGDAYATASGAIDLDGDMALEVDGYNLSAQLLEPWLAPGTRIAGTGDVSISVSGATESPVATGSAEFSDFSFRGMSFERARVTRFDTQQAGLKIEEMLLTKGPHYLAISGTVPFKWSRFTVPGNEPLELRVQLKDQDLAFIRAFFPDVQEASGPLNASLLIGGTPSQPVLQEGFLKISDGRIALPAVGNLKQVSAEVAVQDNLVTINRFNAASASGGSISVRPGSTIRMENPMPQRLASNRFDVGVTARDFAVRVGGAARGPVQADLQLTNSQDGNALIRGKATARSGWQLNLGKESTSAKPWAYQPFDPNLDIALEVQPFMYITSTAAELAMAGRGRISGTLSSPVLSAGLEGRRGWLLFPAARLRVTYASAEISVHPAAEEGFEARTILRLEGNAAVSGYEVFATLTGPVDNLAISRRSVPALTGQQVDALLTAGVLPATGTGPGGPPLGETARELLVAGLGTVALSPLERRFASGLGLEELSVEFNYGEPVRVRAGTYVLGGPLKGSLYLSYVRSLGGKAATSLARATYQLTPSLYLGWSLDERNIGRIELQRTTRF